MARFSHTRFRESDPTYLWKVILRIFATFLAIISIVLFAWSLSYRPRPGNPPSLSPFNINDQDQNYSDKYTYGFAELLSWEFITLSLSIVWNLANLITFYARQGKDIHPGANLTCDLLLGLGLLVTSVIACLGASLSLWDYGGDNYSGRFDGSEYNRYSNGTYYRRYPNGTEMSAPCSDFVTCKADKGRIGAVHAKGIAIATGITMTLIIMLVHLALSISACRYTNARQHGYGMKQAKSITEEAAILARKMISDMAGPGGGFISVNGNGEQVNVSAAFPQGQEQPPLHGLQQGIMQQTGNDEPGSLGTLMHSEHLRDQETQERFQQPFELAHSDLSPLRYRE